MLCRCDIFNYDQNAEVKVKVRKNKISLFSDFELDY